MNEKDVNEIMNEDVTAEAIEQESSTTSDTSCNEAVEEAGAASEASDSTEAETATDTSEASTEQKAEETTEEIAIAECEDTCKTLPDISIRRFDETLVNLIDKVDALDTEIREKIVLNEYQEKISNQMYEELQLYRKDIYAQLTKPILRDVVSLRDEMVKKAEKCKDKLMQDSITADDIKKLAEDIIDIAEYDFNDIFDNNSIEVYRSNPGDDFVPLRHSVLRKVTTNDQSKNGKIEKSFGFGYAYGENGRIFRPEKVNVYVYEALEGADNRENESEETNNG